MNVLPDGLSVLADHWRLVSGILVIVLLSQFLVYSAIKLIFGSGLTSGEYYSLAISGWMLPASFLSLLWFLWETIRAPLFFTLVISIIVFVVMLFFRIEKGVAPDPKAVALGLLFLFCISVILRLAFVSKALIPFYFDSAQHYLTIKNLVEGTGASSVAGSFKWPVAGYYHLGFHLVAGFVASAMRVEITDAMLVLGQMILVVTPISSFFILRHETGSNSAGLFVVMLSAFGWYMPAYAVNWGKYPALASLALIQFALSIAYLSLQGRNILSLRKSCGVYAILGAGILTSGFTHSRSLVIFGIAALAWVGASWWQNLPRRIRVFIFYLIITGIILEIVLIQSQDVFGPLFDPYIQKGYLVTAGILFLSIFAQRACPHLAFPGILSIFLLLGSLFVPVVVPGYGNLTLLDRPFVEMILYLPLSLLGGLGLAGLEQKLQHAQGKLGNLHFMWGKHAGLLAIGLVLINAYFQYNLYPSDCCAIVSADDLVAMDWMDKNLPPDARILIASTELRVLATGSFQGYVSGDAGAWITPLTDRATFPLPYDSDFTQQNILDVLCTMDATHIYVGGTFEAFDASQLKTRPDWYGSLLSMPKAEIYQVVGCN